MPAATLPYASGPRQRSANDEVLLALRIRGVASRADIARLTGLSRTRVGQVVENLARSSLVREATASRDSPRHVGRPGTMLRIAPGLGFAVGVNVTHNEVRVIATDIAHSMITRAQATLGAVDDFSAEHAKVVEVIDTVIAACGTQHGPCLGIGVALRGPVDPATRRATAASIPQAWVGAPVAEELQKRFRMPVYVDNHGNLAVLAELLWGGGRETRDFIWLSLDAGVGGGIAADGRVLRGGGGMAGEFGHMIVDPDGVICRCGNQGCLETVAGVSGLLAMLNPSFGALDLGGALTLIEAGEPAALRAVHNMGTSVGIALATLVNILNPSTVFLGGALSRRCGDTLLDAVTSELRRRALPEHGRHVTVRFATLRRAEPLGAAAAVLTDPSRRLVVERGRPLWRHDGRSVAVADGDGAGPVAAAPDA